MLFTDEFDYKLFLGKCRHLIKYVYYFILYTYIHFIYKLLFRYDHVYHIIANFKYSEPGYSVLLNSLLDYVKYKEYNILTDYLIQHFEEVSSSNLMFVYFTEYCFLQDMLCRFWPPTKCIQKNFIKQRSLPGI